MEAKIIDGHVWLDVTEKSKELYGILELYVLYQDGTESVIGSFIDLLDSIKNGHVIAIDTGTNITQNTIWCDHSCATITNTSGIVNAFSNCTNMYDSYKYTNDIINKQELSLVDKMRPYTQGLEEYRERLTEYGISVTIPF